MDGLSVAQFLKHERQRRGMSQSKLSLASGISEGTIASMEKTGGARIDTMMKIIRCWWDDMASFGEDYDDWKIQ